mmetsp:Transcript_13570/g.23089  ORF Transcript_13570/g.23089 Transcript_13570/m.23089 type:complete len:208 (+) Transcript_13570:20-643(+)
MACPPPHINLLKPLLMFLKIFWVKVFLGLLAYWGLSSLPGSLAVSWFEKYLEGPQVATHVAELHVSVGVLKLGGEEVVALAPELSLCTPLLWRSLLLRIVLLARLTRIDLRVVRVLFEAGVGLVEVRVDLLLRIHPLLTVLLLGDEHWLFHPPFLGVQNLLLAAERVEVMVVAPRLREYVLVNSKLLMFPLPPVQGPWLVLMSMGLP